eukprot:Pompholyxophrys_punicea_v1_NODE_1013_length_1042_cov_9.591692.p2 type:complete len:122 gc:universal NODE_1013_length_1042_cov_9.591692:705-340(-)
MVNILVVVWWAVESGMALSRRMVSGRILKRLYTYCLLDIVSDRFTRFCDLIWWKIVKTGRWSESGGGMVVDVMLVEVMVVSVTSKIDWVWCIGSILVVCVVVVYSWLWWRKCVNSCRVFRW